MLLVSAASWGLYWVLIKRDLAGHDQQMGFGVNAIYTAIALIIAMFLFGDWRTLLNVSPHMWGILACSGCVGLLFAHVLLYHTIQHLGPVVTDGAKCVQPFLTAVGAWFVLNEALEPAQWVGGFVLVASSALLLSLRFGKRNVPAPLVIPTPLAGEES
jgi:drug/metabolite transporter (DMT)-like permease